MQATNRAMVALGDIDLLPRAQVGVARSTEELTYRAAFVGHLLHIEHEQAIDLGFAGVHVADLRAGHGSIFTWPISQCSRRTR